MELEKRTDMYTLQAYDVAKKCDGERLSDLISIPWEPTRAVVQVQQQGSPAIRYKGDFFPERICHVTYKDGGFAAKETWLWRDGPYTTSLPDIFKARMVVSVATSTPEEFVELRTNLFPQLLQAEYCDGGAEFHFENMPTVSAKKGPFTIELRWGGEEPGSDALRELLESYFSDCGYWIIGQHDRHERWKVNEAMLFRR